MILMQYISVKPKRKKFAKSDILQIKERLNKDKRLLLLWAAKCAKHVLPYFEKKYPRDDRPARAIEGARYYMRGIITFNELRARALASHAAARKCKDLSARAAARAAGQAISTGHAVLHCIAAANYANTAAIAKGKFGERDWQFQQLPKRLLPVMKKLVR